PTMNFVEGPTAARYDAQTIGVRPEHISVSTTPVEGGWKGTVGVAEHLGADTFSHVETEGQGTINVRSSGEVPIRHGDTVWLTPHPDRIYRFGADGLAL
ncbi:TOBE domain-containing protein, partial [Amaricoccus solimangrovi]